MKAPVVAVTGLNRGENPQPGYAVVRSLRRRFADLTVIGLLYDAMESGLLADDGPDWAYTIPYPSAGTRPLLERLDFIRERHRIDMLIPTLDAEIEPLIRLEPDLAARGIRTCLPTLEAFRARSKSVLDRLCAECDCSTPQFELAHDLGEARRYADQLGYPVMIKGQYYDARRANDESELAYAFYTLSRIWGIPVLVQECIQGSEFNVMGVGDGRGGITGLCVVRKTILSSQGKGLGAVVLEEPRLEEMAARIVSHLRWRGPFELELMHDEESDTYRVLEMNPRFPAWADFPSALGLNLPAQVVSLALDGRADREPPIPAGRFFIRHQIELIGSMEDLALLMTEGIWKATRKPL